MNFSELSVGIFLKGAYRLTSLGSRDDLVFSAVYSSRTNNFGREAFEDRFFRMPAFFFFQGNAISDFFKFIMGS